MTPFVERLHTEHKQRLARFAEAAMRHNTVPFKPAPRPAPASAEEASPPLRPISDDQFKEAHDLLEGVINKVEIIQRAVLTKFTGITLNDLKSARKPANVARARQIAMYLCKELTGKSLPDIGRRFGGRDHTTVLHAVRKIALQVQQDEDLSALIEAIKEDLK
jgi:chromosomal replication initiation ATPase DnaA